MCRDIGMHSQNKLTEVTSIKSELAASNAVIFSVAMPDPLEQMLPCASILNGMK